MKGKTMSYCVVIRGPAAVGKTTVAGAVARAAQGLHLCFDEVMAEHGLDTIKGDGIPATNFIKADDIVVPVVVNALQQGKVVVLDGCFYREEQLKDLKARIKSKIIIFTLHASVDKCLERNAARNNALSEDAVRAVHALVSKKDHGKVIETDAMTFTDVVAAILASLPSIPCRRHNEGS